MYPSSGQFEPVTYTALLRHVESEDCSSPPFYPLFSVITVMAALIFHGGHENRVAQALAIPLANGASGRASADSRPFVLVSLVDGYEIRDSTGFNQSLCLLFAKTAVSNAQEIRFSLSNSATNDYGQETIYLSAIYAPITTGPWYCHHCGHCHELYTPRCVNCNHDRCPYCTVE